MLMANNIRRCLSAGLDANTRAQRQDMLPAGRGGGDCGYHRLWNGYRQPDVRFVIHYNIPKSWRTITRKQAVPAATTGKASACVFYSHKDVQNWST